MTTPRLRGRHLLLAACCVFVACSGRSGDAGSSTQKQATSTTEAPEPSIAQGMSTFVVGDEVWTGGGIRVSAPPDERPKVESVVAEYRRFDASGAESGQTESNDLGEQFVFSASVAPFPDGSTLLVENRCPVPGPRNENFGCSQPEPWFFRVTEGVTTQLDVRYPELDEPSMVNAVLATDKAIVTAHEPLNGSAQMVTMNL